MFRRPTVLRSHATVPCLSFRPFSTTTPSLSALFNLNGLAHSRESQYLAKERGLPRTEYSSNIHLIRSSEVDPFPNAPGASKHANESRSSSHKRAGRQATIAASPKTNEALVRYLSDSTHPAQQRKRIEEFVVQQTALNTALRVEIAHLHQLRAATKAERPDGLGPDGVGTRGSGSIPGWATMMLLLGGGFAFTSWLWPAEFQKLPSGKEEAENYAAEISAEANPAAHTEFEDMVPAFDNVSGPQSVKVALSELSDTESSPTKTRSRLSFLWA